MAPFRTDHGGSRPIALSPYSLWVIGYDIPWTYQLWQLNPGPSR
jgi:hypothetical protein